MGLLHALLLTSSSLFIATTVLWVISVAVKDSSIIDIFWGPFFVLVAWVLFFYSAERSNDEALLVLLLTTLWGLRLFFHLYFRNAGSGEDSRYQRWRANAGASWWWRSFFNVYLLQASIAVFVSAPIIGAMTAPASAVLSPLNVAGLLLWLLGFYFELNSDLQLTRFRARGGRGPLTEGLWRYSRHPNYFGDAAQWWGLGLIALSIANWWVLIGPIVMTTVFLRISSGMLEKGMKRTRPGYEAYQERTPAFIPWFPRRHS